MMKKIIVLILFFSDIIILKAGYFNNEFLADYSVNKPFFSGMIEAGGDTAALEKFGVYASHISTGEMSIDDFDTPIIQGYSHLGFSDNLYGGRFFIFNRGNSIVYNNDIDLKLEQNIYQMNFYQNNKIYNNLISGILGKIFFKEEKFKEDKSLLKELLEGEYTEKERLFGADFWGGIKYNYNGFKFTFQGGPEFKSLSFENSENFKEEYNIISGSFNINIEYNLAFTVFLQPMYMRLSIFYNKDYFEECFGGGLNWKMNKYFSFNIEASQNRYTGIFKMMPFSFFSFIIKAENSAVEYRTRTKYVIDERVTAFFAGIELKFQSLGMPSFRNK